MYLLNQKKNGLGIIFARFLFKTDKQQKLHYIQAAFSISMYFNLIYYDYAYLFSMQNLQCVMYACGLL